MIGANKYYGGEMFTYISKEIKLMILCGEI